MAARNATTEDAPHQDNIPQLGTKILAKSHVGSNRYFSNCGLDALAIVKEYGKPTYLITMTCNTHWPEIVENLQPNLTPQDRPDLVAREFKLY